MKLGCDAVVLALRRRTNPKPRFCRFRGVNSTSAKLLQAALEILGTERELARRLGIGETLLSKFMTDLHPLPDPLLLRAVDIVLENRDPARSPLLAPVESLKDPRV